MADTACIQRETPNLAKSMKRVSKILCLRFASVYILLQVLLVGTSNM